MKKIILMISILAIITSESCKKDPGQGGNSSIKGIVMEKNYNANFTIPYGQFPYPDANVFIKYGDDDTYDDKISTGPDGVFEFKFLRKGDYTIYTYSKDSAAMWGVLGNPGAPKLSVEKKVNISKKKQTVDAGTLTVFN